MERPVNTIALNESGAVVFFIQEICGRPGASTMSRADIRGLYRRPGQSRITVVSEPC
ncbi:MAG: hypothetical protein KJ970_13580 [Candidatus Eisenbacteria bacterium]|uniref:Uncharacterized protein n=1 Tax=Eiseniibacteriota bacterium TaxID=2212470 RepID=A0A948W779_UNCEI|nr:hypothetical protein [Candidatus Eisenbacteria bacterium]